MSLLSTTTQLPRIAPVIDAHKESASAHLYSNSIRHLLRRMLVDDFLFEEFDPDRLSDLKEMLPVFHPPRDGQEGSHLSITLFCAQRPNAVKFFYEMLSRWLIPGKRLDFALFFNADFTLPDWGDEVYTVAEVAIAIENDKQAETILRNLPMIALEIRLGIASAYHARRILEIKGLAADEKTALIQETVASLIHLRPQNFDYDLFSQMQHFLVMCRDEFKAARECQQMSRIIYVFYLFHKALKFKMEQHPSLRHLSVKLAHTRLHLPLGVKQVLSVFVGMNFLKDNEVFEKDHLVAALRNYIPGVVLVEDSFFANTSKEDMIQKLYLEVEKEDGTLFTLEELKRLRKGLPEDLKGRVEQLIRPVFMPRNEEEVMRNILVLSKQLKYIRDLPQVIISFDEQTDQELSFLVILVRVLHEADVGVNELLQDKFPVDRVKIVGKLRNKYPKEASVFRVRLANSDYLRKDNSVDSYRARQKVVSEVQAVFGEVRDYNGGMISKQIEAFMVLKEQLGEVGRRHDFLLENFFHAIFPVELRSVLPAGPLKTLFLLLVEMREKNLSSSLHQEPSRCYALFHLQEEAREEVVSKAIGGLGLSSPALVLLHLKVLNTAYFGAIYFCEDSKMQETFRNALSLDF